MSFKKREHRPWKTELLDETIDSNNQDSQSENEAKDILDNKSKNFTTDFNTDFDSIFDKVMGNTPIGSTDKFSEIAAINPNAKAIQKEQEQEQKNEDLILGMQEEISVSTSKNTNNDTESYVSSTNKEIIEKIKQTKHEEENIKTQIKSRSQDKVLMGGFLSPKDINSSAVSENGRKINTLLDDLKHKEQELNSLTNNLQIAQALERVEKSELLRRAEEQSRISAQNRMNDAINQTKAAAEQLKLAMRQAQQAEEAQKAEERQRIAAEEKLDKLNAKFENLNIQVKTECQIRKEAEEKAQHALNQTIQTELARQELQEKDITNTKQIQELNAKIRKIELDLEAEISGRNESEKKYIEIKTTFEKINSEHKSTIAKLGATESDYIDIKKRYEEQDHDYHAMKAENLKLKKIIESEQELRKVTERKLEEAKEEASIAVAKQKEEEKMRKMIDERAKKAVAHASKTVMQFLSTPVDESDIRPEALDTKPTKPKIKIQANKEDY